MKRMRTGTFHSLKITLPVAFVSHDLFWHMAPTSPLLFFLVNKSPGPAISKHHSVKASHFEPSWVEGEHVTTGCWLRCATNNLYPEIRVLFLQRNGVLRGRGHDAPRGQCIHSENKPCQVSSFTSRGNNKVMFFGGFRFPPPFFKPLRLNTLCTCIWSKTSIN